MQLSEHLFIAWIFISTFILLPGHWAFRCYTSIARSDHESRLESVKDVPQIPESCLNLCGEWSAFAKGCKATDPCFCSKQQRFLIQQCFECAMPYLRRTTRLGLGLSSIIDQVAAEFNDTCLKSNAGLAPISEISNSSTLDPTSDNFLAIGIAVKISHLLLVCYVVLFKS